MAILTLIGLVFIVFVIRVIYKLIIKPYQLVQFYRKQNLTMIHIPLGGVPFLHKKDTDVHGDFCYTMKQYAAKDPKPIAGGGNLGGTCLLALYDTQLLKEFFTHHENYEKPMAIFGLFKELIGEGLILAEGKQWKRHRKYVSIAFHYDLLKNMVPEVVKITEELFEKLKTKGFNAVNIMDLYQSITGEVVGRLFFGEKFSEYAIDNIPVTEFLADLIGRTSGTCFSLAGLVLGPKFIKMGLIKTHKKLMQDIKKFRKFSVDIVSNKMKELSVEHAKGINEKRKNMLEFFFEQRLQSPEDALKDIEIVDEFATFFVAGMDTTGHMITMATYYLLANPQFKDDLMKEIDQNFANPAKVTIDELNKMDFMTAFMKETLRMASPAPFVFSRTAMKDCTIGDINVKHGTSVGAWFNVNNFDPRFHEDPYSFNPRRWLDPNSLTNKTLEKNPFAFSPFSIGGRNCIGQHLAMNEARIIFSLFLKKFDFAFTNKDYKLIMKLDFLYEPQESIKLDLKPKV